MRGPFFVHGYSVTIDDNEQVTITHKPGDSMEGALNKHHEILRYLHEQGFFKSDIKEDKEGEEWKSE